MIEAYAVRRDGEILPDTVCTTEVGAMVNYLVIHLDVLLTRFHTDAQIEGIFAHVTGTCVEKVSVVKVSIMEILR